MQKGTAALLLLVIIIGTISLGLLGRVSLGLFKLPVSTAQLPLKISTPAPEILTYTNRTLSFTLEYPKGSSVREDSEEEFDKRGNGNFRKNFKGYVGYEPGKFLGAVSVLDTTNSFDNSPFTIWVFDNQDDLTVDSWFNKYWYYPYLWGVFDYTSKGHIALDTEATISGHPAKYKIVSYQPGKPKFVYVSNGKKMYLFRMIGESGDTILSTFKFTN